MSKSPHPPQGDLSDLTDFTGRMSELGRVIGERESAHCAGITQARNCVAGLRDRVEKGLNAFHIAVTKAGAPHLEIALSEIRTDDKHLRSVEFEIIRGRYKAIVTGKSRGDITLVGPFRMGKAEGPCRTFPVDATEEIDAALVIFLEQFLEEAATP